MKTIAILIFSITIASCGQNKIDEIEKNEKINNTEHSIYENKSIKEVTENLKDGMINYLQYADNEYTKEDVEKCIKIIKTFEVNIAKSNSKIEGLKLIDSTVIQLNELNKQCGGRLIETDQREAICHIINSIGFKKGYNSLREDTTAKLREW